MSTIIPAQNVKRKSFQMEIRAYSKVIIKTITKELFPNTLSELSQLKLMQPFPHRAISKIQKDFQCVFKEEWCLNGDLNTYWRIIAGSLSYLMKEHNHRMEDSRLQWLFHSFFQQFPQYTFLEEEIENYPNLYEEYMEYEKARILILYYLTLRKAF